MPWETLEPLVHVMGSLYNEEKTKAVLLVDAKNAFNVVNRKAFYINQHNLSFCCHLRVQSLFQTTALVCYWQSRNIVIRRHDTTRSNCNGGICYSNYSVDIDIEITDQYPMKLQKKLLMQTIEDKAKEIFGGSGAQIITDGKRRLGASLGSNNYRDEHPASKVN